MLTSLFLLSALLLIRVFWILNDDTACVETKLGQEMYRLLIFYFFITIILNMIVETIWSFLYFKGGLEEWLPEPEFDIRNGSVLNNLGSTSSFFSLSYNQNHIEPFVQSEHNKPYLLPAGNWPGLLLLAPPAPGHLHHPHHHFLPSVLSLQI